MISIREEMKHRQERIQERHKEISKNTSPPYRGQRASQKPAEKVDITLKILQSHDQFEALLKVCTCLEKEGTKLKTVNSSIFERARFDELLARFLKIGKNRSA